jgi:hypothetical protein
MNININLTEKSNTYYKRNDGTIVGPFIQTPNGNFWDLTDEKLYNSEGKRLNPTTLLPENVVAEDLQAITNYRKSIITLEDGKRYIRRNGSISKKLRKINDDIFEEILSKQDVNVQTFEYSSNGWTEKHEIDGLDLVLIANNENLDLIKYIRKARQFDVSEINDMEEEDFCMCNECVNMRIEFDTKGTTNLIEGIKMLRKNIEDIFWYLPELPMLNKLSLSIQREMFQFYSDLNDIFDEKEIMEKARNIAFPPIIKFDLKPNFDVLPDPSSKSAKSQKQSKSLSKEDEEYQSDKYIEFSELQSKFLIEKNIIFDYPIDKFFTLKLKNLQIIIDSAIQMYISAPKFEKRKTIKFKPVLKQLKREIIDKNKWVSDEEKIQGQTFVTMLNPLYLYTIKVVDGKIHSVIPFTKNENEM